MKYSFELQKTPNQKFNTMIGGNNFEFRFRSFRSATYIDLYINGELAEAGVRGVPNESLFTAETNRIANGVFMFESESDEYPYYTAFDGYTCNFVFVEG